MGPNYRDLWRLDLNKLDQWTALPPYPIPESITGKFDAWHMTVYQDKAYLFTGSRRVDFFDLVTEQWGHISTTIKRGDGLAGAESWPYPDNTLNQYTMEVADGKIYVFGGIHQDADIGCNLFLALDVESRQWEKLSGTVLPKADHDCPGPRRFPSSWIDPKGGNFMLMFGEAARQSARIGGQPNGAQLGFGYEDLWSWSLQDRKWRREKITGNPPCPRSEMAATYVCHVFTPKDYLANKPTFFIEFEVEPNRCFRWLQSNNLDVLQRKERSICIFILC